MDIGPAKYAYHTGATGMNSGHLSQYFIGIAAKQLSAVEADPRASNQHEFNGVGRLHELFGDAKQTFTAKFLYLNDTDSDPVIANGFLTWYDAREAHAIRTEYRLYFPTTSVSQCASEGDLLIIGKRPDNTVLVVIAEENSTIGNQILWLFGLEVSGPRFSVRSELETEQDRIEFAASFILEQIGVEIETTEQSYLDIMLQNFNGTFPTTREFSAYARSTLNAWPQDDPDNVLMAWMEREEVLFRTLERHLIGDRLSGGFKDDVDSFLSFSLSVQNRRKSRVGLALENHLEELFAQSSVRYSRVAITENKSKPDFIFPGITEYRDPRFPDANLTMLGAKSTCKDRWRQVLAEAERIPAKHLLTLEAAISTAQTAEMRSSNLQLIVPRSLHSSYTQEQQRWLMDVSAFLSVVRARQ